MSGEDIASSWAATGTTEEWHATQTFFAHYDPTNTTKWRHRRPGRSPRWEDLLVKVFGDWWRTNGLDRRAWHSSRSFFVWQACNFLLGTGHRAFGVCESRLLSHMRCLLVAFTVLLPKRRCAVKSNRLDALRLGSLYILEVLLHRKHLIGCTMDYSCKLLVIHK